MDCHDDTEFPDEENAIEHADFWVSDNLDGWKDVSIDHEAIWLDILSEGNNWGASLSSGTWSQFDPNQMSEGIAGQPAEDIQYWHMQNESHSCAVAVQQFALESITEQSYSEAELCQEAFDNGWYIPGSGTPMYHMGSLLEAHGIEVDRREGCSIEDLREQLNQNNQIFVSIDADEIRTPGLDYDDYLNSFNGLPGQNPNHAVQVIGIDDSDIIPKIILNDPGVQNGQGLMVPAGTFMGAWEDSGFYMVNTTGNNTDSQIMLGALDRWNRPYHASSGEYYLPFEY